MSAGGITAPPRIALVVAAARNNVIGMGGGLPWRISDDLKWFKAVTMGKPVVMGRKTFDSLPRPLPGRDNIVVTRALGWSREGALPAGDLAAALRFGADSAHARGVDEVCVIGGADIYRQTLPLADRIYLTRVEAEVEGDVFFPPLDPGEWRERPEGGCEAGPKNEHACRFFVLDRLRPAS